MQEVVCIPYTEVKMYDKIELKRKNFVQKDDEQKIMGGILPKR